MRILLAPAKKMRVDTDTLAPLGLPDFLDRTERLLTALRSRTPDELRALWKCNEAIAAQNVERLAHMDLRRGLTPAVLSYEGIAYRYLAPGVLEDAELDYLQEHNGVNQKAIAAGCHMEPASVSSVLAGMEHAGLIRRQAEPGDRRSLRVYLTALGEEKAEQTCQVFASLEEQALRGLNESQRRELVALLVQVVENLKDEKGEAE